MEGTSRMHPDNSEQILVASRFHGNKRGLKGNSLNLHRYYATILYPKDFFPSHPSFKPFPQNKIHQSFTLPLSFNHRRVPSASSCGLVYFYDYLATIIVCNPATEQSRTLPSLWALEQVMLGSGFGYDPTSDDYKIVRVYTSDDSYIDDIRAQVHALKSDCWKEIKMMPDLPRFDIDNVGGVYVSGSCYWIVALQFRNSYSILSFDFATETFSTLHLPQPLPPRHGYRLVELDGRLGAILYKRFDRMDVRRHTNVFEVWVLEEGSSWVIHSRVPIDNASVPLALRHDVLFFEGKCDFDNRVNQLFVYDLVAEKVEALDVFDRPGSMMVIPYVETTYAIPDYEQMTKYTEHERKRDHDHDEHVECILVDENDHVVDPETKYICHMMEKIEALNLLHRAFSVFLFNSKYELLLQQRSKTKVTFPLVWTNTCCSLPLSRDSELIEENALGVRNAAQRKLLDELGIPAEDVPVDQFIPLGRMLYKAPSDGKLDYLLFIVRDVRVHPNPDQVHDVKYVNREELKELLRKADAGDGGSELSPWFRLVVDHFLFKWWDHVEKGTIKEAADMKTIRNLT